MTEKFSALEIETLKTFLFCCRSCHYEDSWLYHVIAESILFVVVVIPLGKFFIPPGKTFLEGMTIDIAVSVMQEAHQNGLAQVITCAQDEAEEYCEGLRGNGLTSTIEPATS